MFEKEREDFNVTLNELRQFILHEVKEIISVPVDEFIEWVKKHWSPKNEGFICIDKDKYTLEINKIKTGFVVKLVYNDKCIPCVFSKDHILLNSFFKDITYAYYLDNFKKDLDLVKQFLKEFNKQ